MSALKTAADLAEYFQVTERKLLDWRKEYGWPCVQVGRSIRFTDEQVAEIVARHTVSETAKAPTTPAALIGGQTRRRARRSA